MAETAPRSILVSKLRKTAAPPLVAGCRAVFRRNPHATVIFVERAWTIIFSFLGPTDGGKANDPLPTSGAPIWPAKIVGSLAHDSDVAVAAIAARGSFATIGIDVEPAEALHLKLLNIVATLLWQSAMASHRHGDRLY